MANVIKIIFDAEDKVSPKANNIKAHLQGLAIGAGAVMAVAAIAVKELVNQMKDLTEVAKKRPELFTDKELANIQDYNNATGDMTDAWAKWKAQNLAPAMTDIARDMAHLTGFTLEQRKAMVDLDKAYRDGTISVREYQDGMTDAGIAQEEWLTSAQTGLVVQQETNATRKQELDLIKQLMGASDEATPKIIYNNLMQKLSVDGITEAEMEMATSAGVALGIFDRATAESAAGINRLTNEVIAGTLEVSNLKSEIDKLEDRRITITVNTIGAFQAANQWGRASGGSVNRGEPYLVGERGPELMVPGQSGTIVPNNQLGGSNELLREIADEMRQMPRLIAAAVLRGQA